VIKQKLSCLRRQASIDSSLTPVGSLPPPGGGHPPSGVIAGMTNFCWTLIFWDLLKIPHAYSIFL